jgi:hypothetical protein
MPFKLRREMDAWQDFISHEIDVSNELDVDFNLGKIHLMAYWVERISRYAALQQYSAERLKQAHKSSLNDGWNASNHNVNYVPQVITLQCRILCFKIIELNPQALAERHENSAGTSKVLHSGADRAAPLSSQAYVKLEFMEPQNRRDGKHRDLMI